MKRSISIGPRQVGTSLPCLVIAEAGVNHNGDRELALRLIDAAAGAGADAVKFQTFNARKLATRDARTCEYQRNGADRQPSQLELLAQLELSHDDHRMLLEYCHQRNILFLSTPFDDESLELLYDLDIAAYKVPSGEITNLDFLRRIAAKRKPLLLSTGMSSLGEVEQAVEAIESAGNDEAILLHCVSNYPAAFADVNLRAMSTLGHAFDVAVGYSDHTEGIAVSVAAVALGACVIEKHLTLDRQMPGPDHAASIEPDEFLALVAAIRDVEAALGSTRKRASSNEKETAAHVRKSLVAACDIAAGDRLNDDAIVAMRPGTGLPPSMRPHLLHRRAKRDIAAGTLLELEMLT